MMACFDTFVCNLMVGEMVVYLPHQYTMIMSQTVNRGYNLMCTANLMLQTHESVGDLTQSL